MAIGPQGPLLKNDGPACRVCGCTASNACVLPAKQPKHRPPGNYTMTCSWVRVVDGSKPLCTACSGTAQDLAESFGRSQKVLHGAGITRLKVERAYAIGLDALSRYRAREKAESRK